MMTEFQAFTATRHRKGIWLAVSGAALQLGQRLGSVREFFLRMLNVSNLLFSKIKVLFLVGIAMSTKKLCSEGVWETCVRVLD